MRLGLGAALRVRSDNSEVVAFKLDPADQHDVRAGVLRRPSPDKRTVIRREDMRQCWSSSTGHACDRPFRAVDSNPEIRPSCVCEKTNKQPRPRDPTLSKVGMIWASESRSSSASSEDANDSAPRGAATDRGHARHDRHEMNCQVIHDSIHARPGWTHEYLITDGSRKVGYASVAVAGPWQAKPTVYEFFLLPQHRDRMFDAFIALLKSSGVTEVETQSNDVLLTVVLHTFGPR